MTSAARRRRVIHVMSESNRAMSEQPSKDPLHGVTLEMMVTGLVEQYGWEKLGNLIPIKCFTHDPSIKSSLKFLRKTPWARDKIERLYLNARGTSLPERG